MAEERMGGKMGHCPSETRDVGTPPRFLKENMTESLAAEFDILYLPIMPWMKKWMDW